MGLRDPSCFLECMLHSIVTRLVRLCCCRDAYLLVLEDLQKESPWRFRKLLAKFCRLIISLALTKFRQMSKLVCLYDTKSLKQYLLPIYYNLLDDDVHKVRQTAVLQVFQGWWTQQFNTFARLAIFTNVFVTLVIANPEPNS